jgi:hypothetical protein
MLATLAAWGLGTLGKALLSKGIEEGCKFVKDKTGVDIDPTQPGLGVSNEDRLKLLQFQMENETELQRMAYSFDVQQERERTKRHETDMDSDSWLSKNVRPLTFLASVLLVIVATFTSDTVNEARFETVVEMAEWFGSFYVVARSSDKLFPSAANRIQSVASKLAKK